MVYDWILIGAFVLAIVLGLVRFNATISVALLFCITFIVSIGASRGDNWGIATIATMAIGAGLVLSGVYYLAKRFSPWRKTTTAPSA